jgi:hypothetical protein
MAIEGVTQSGQRQDVGDFHDFTDAGSSGAQRAIPRERAIAALTLVVALLALALGIWLRVVAIDWEGFWLDEIYSASFANLSFVGTLLAVLVLDVHPPLYYLQLNAWGLLGHGDVWLLLNSVAWSTGAMLGVFFGTRREFGSRSAVLALLVCAVMGGEVYFAHELRMYPMASCLTVLSWVAANRVARDYRFVTAVPMIVVLAALGAIHSASIIPASAAMLYVFPRGSRSQAACRRGLAFPPWWQPPICRGWSMLVRAIASATPRCRRFLRSSRRLAAGSSATVRPPYRHGLEPRPRFLWCWHCSQRY